MQTTAPVPRVSPRTFPGWLSFFAPAPVVPVTLSDSTQIEHAFRSWRARILFASTLGYAVFYFVRSNLDIAMPFLERDLGISKKSLGVFLTLHGVIYGLSKFANGFLGDRCNARALMSTGLLLSALVNVLFGFSSTAVVFGVLWMINGLFQGMGFPPCARLLTHWFPPTKLPTKMSIWNTSHCIGAGVIFVLCGYLAPISWHLCFLVPAAIAFTWVIVLWLILPDTPPSVGLPEVEGTKVVAAGAPPEDFRETVMNCVFRNKYVWLVAIANFFVYTLRYSLGHWGATFLTQAKHVTIVHAGWMLLGFEFSGMIGALVAGRLTERWFGGRPARASVFFMILSGLSILAFWKYGGESKAFSAFLFCIAGFCIYGPQCLVGIAAANLATKRAAATAVGLTGLFGYASSVLYGYGLGAVVQEKGWDAGFAGLIAVTIIGTLVFAAAWPAKAHGYQESSNV